MIDNENDSRDFLSLYLGFSNKNSPNNKFKFKKVLLNVILLVSFIILLFSGINHGLWRPDEHRVAGICAEMTSSSNWAVPRINGKAFLEKPPLYFIMGAFAGLLGDKSSDIPYRIISLIFTLLTLWLTFKVSKLYSNSQQAFISVCILATFFLFFRTSRWIQIDIMLVFGVTLGMFSYFSWLKGPKNKYILLLAFAYSLSFMVKGLVGPAIITISIIIDSIRLGQIKNIWKLRPFTIFIIAIIPISIWGVFLYRGGGYSYVYEVFVVNNFMRFAGIGKGAKLGHQNGIFYYISRFPANIAPWTLLFIPAIVHALRNFKKSRFLMWFLAPLFLLCLSSTKRDVYLLPLYPAIAFIITNWLFQERTFNKAERIFIYLTYFVILLFCIAPFAGFFIGVPIYGLLAGMFSIFSLIFLVYSRKNFINLATPLILAGSIGLLSSSLVYFSYLTPRKDYLSFAKEAVKLAKGREIIILDPDEIFDAIMPMVSGKYHKEVESVEELSEYGLYIWTDSSYKTLKKLQNAVSVEVLLKRKLGSRNSAIFAIINPNKMDK